MVMGISTCLTLAIFTLKTTISFVRLSQIFWPSGASTRPGSHVSHLLPLSSSAATKLRVIHS